MPAICGGMMLTLNTKIKKSFYCRIVYGLSLAVIVTKLFTSFEYEEKHIEKSIIDNYEILQSNERGTAIRLII